MPKNSPATPSHQTKAPTPRERLLAAAAHLDSFASVVPLVFNQAEGTRLVCVNQAGHQWHGPEPHEALQRFYKAIEEVDETLKQLGCEGPEGQPLLPGYVMVWAKWMWLNPARSWPDHARQALTLGKSLERWWATCRTQTDATSKHPWCWSVDAGAAEFARAAAVEARAIGEGIPEESPATPSGQNPTDELERTTIPFSEGDGLWVKSSDAAKIDRLETGTLATYRTRGIRNAERTLGRDPDGRVWRRPGTPHSRTWYLRSSLRNHHRKS